MNGKIKKIASLKSALAALKKRGKHIVFTNGCFDILHVGHIDYLSKAKKMGDVLVIGLNSDSSIRRLKGRSRPINKEEDRAMVLSALWFVDFVTIFNEDTPEKLVRSIGPDIMVKGSDWKGKCVAGADFVRSNGGRLVFVPLVKGYSTTSTIKRLK